ncbi:MAG TPA: alpha/beta fold hydrolase [Geodermatophilus sp.]|nr:alpha/beta fold hydrolase [Geodermatophilus sp.]
MSFSSGSRGRIFHHAWLPEDDAAAVVVLLHGYGEHLGLYEAFARRLVRDGIAVHAMDAVGHGRSDGERGVIPSWDVFVDDARQLVGLARDAHPGRPLVLAGHSAGGLAAYLLALRFPEVAAALVLSGAPLRAVPWVQEMLDEDDAAEAVAVDPGEMFSTHPEYLHALLHDPLTYHGGFRRETLRAIISAWPEVADGLAAGRPDLPVLFVHGEADQIVPLADAQANAAQLPRAAMATFPGDLHDVLNESDRDCVHDAVAAFVTASVGLVCTTA